MLADHVLVSRAIVEPGEHDVRIHLWGPGLEAGRAFRVTIPRGQIVVLVVTDPRGCEVLAAIRERLPDLLHVACVLDPGPSGRSGDGVPAGAIRFGSEPVPGAVQASSTDAQRGTPVVVLDLRAHPAQRVGDAAHGSLPELVTAVEGAVEGLPGQYARQQAHRGPRVDAITGSVGGLEISAADRQAGCAIPPDLDAQRLDGLERGASIAAVQPSANRASAACQCAE